MYTIKTKTRRQRQATIKGLLAVCALSVVGGVARGNLVTNPSFETEVPAVAAGSFQLFNTGSTGIAGWTATGAAGTQIAAVSTTFVQDGITFEAENGNVWIDLTGYNSNSTEGIEQTVTTATGTNYVLTFYVGNTTGAPGTFGLTSEVGLDINGTQVNTYTNSNADLTGLNWEQFTYDFTAAGTSTTIGFVNLDSSSDNSNGLDMVDLEVGASSVPEPASIGLVGSALALIAFLMRRKG
jgi:hypothetical protein